MAMQSPATNFASHIRTIRELVLKAYRQCSRLIEYLAIGGDQPIFRLTEGKYEEVAKINLNNFRCVFPIGLTVEAFTPFSAMCKEIPEVVPILGRHAFISVSVDDLFVLGRFFACGRRAIPLFGGKTGSRRYSGGYHFRRTGSSRCLHRAEPFRRRYSQAIGRSGSCCMGFI
jgi:hypothetical protein